MDRFIPKEVAVVPGIDGRKMSKSYGNAIELFAAEKATKKRIMSIVTDSLGIDDPKDPDDNNAFAIFKLLLDEGERRDWEDRLRAGGVGYGELKKALFERFLDFFGPMRKRRAELEARPDYVEDVFREGARRAREITLPLIESVRAAVGIPTAAS